MRPSAGGRPSTGSGGTGQHTEDPERVRPLVTRCEYDEEGRMCRIEHPDETAERFRYDCCSLLGVLAHDGMETSYRYDTGRRLVERAENGNPVERFKYDDEGRVVARGTRSDKGWLVTATTYDKSGRVIAEQVDDAKPVRHFYDDAGRRTRTVYADATESVYCRDKRGRVVGVRGSHQDQTDTEYDEVGRVLAETVRVPGPEGRIEEQVTRYQYDERGNRTAIEYPDGRRSVWVYDSAGVLAGALLDGRVEKYVYDEAGRLSETYASTGTKYDPATAVLREKRDYDAYGRLIAAAGDKSRGAAPNPHSTSSGPAAATERSAPSGPPMGDRSSGGGGTPPEERSASGFQGDNVPLAGARGQSPRTQAPPAALGIAAPGLAPFDGSQSLGAMRQGMIVFASPDCPTCTWVKLEWLPGFLAASPGLRAYGVNVAETAGLALLTQLEKELHADGGEIPAVYLRGALYYGTARIGELQP